MGVIYKRQLFHPAGPFSTQQIPLHTQQISRSVNVNYLDRQFHQLTKEFASGRREWAQDEEPGCACGEARGACGGLPLNALDLHMHAMAKMTAITFTRRQKLAGFFRAFGFDAPFLDARHEHGGVERLRCRFELVL
jgi:hypothetical protein